MASERVPSAEKGGARALLLTGNYDPVIKGVDSGDVTRLKTEISIDIDRAGFKDEVARRVRLVKLAMYAVSLCHEQPIQEDGLRELSRELGRSAILLGNYDFSSLQSKLKDSLAEKGGQDIPSFDAVEDMATQQAINSYEAAEIKVILSAAVISVLGGRLPSLDHKV